MLTSENIICEITNKKDGHLYIYCSYLILLHSRISRKNKTELSQLLNLSYYHAFHLYLFSYTFPFQYIAALFRFSSLTIMARNILILFLCKWIRNKTITLSTMMITISFCITKCWSVSANFAHVVTFSYYQGKHQCPRPRIKGNFSTSYADHYKDIKIAPSNVPRLDYKY